MRDKRFKRFTSAAMAAIITATSVMPYMATEADTAIPIEAASETDEATTPQNPVQGEVNADVTDAPEAQEPSETEASGETAEAQENDGQETAEPGKAEEGKAEEDAGDHEQRSGLHIAAGHDHLSAHDRGVGDHHV